MGDLFLSLIGYSEFILKRGGVHMTELVFVLDRSGSMGGLESDTIGGFNSMLEKQKKLDGKVFVTTILFDDRYEVLHDRVELEHVKPLSHADYFVRGMTALLDAVGKTIARVKSIDVSSKEKRQVLFVIMTDGLENASREYSYKTIKQRINRLTSDASWEFIFLGANIDAVEVGSRFGMREDKVVNYHADEAGVQLNYQVISDAVTQYRETKEIGKNWKAKIDKDFKTRKKS